MFLVQIKKDDNRSDLCIQVETSKARWNICMIKEAPFMGSFLLWGSEGGMAESGGKWL